MSSRGGLNGSGLTWTAAGWMLVGGFMGYLVHMKIAADRRLAELAAAGVVPR